MGLTKASTGHSARKERRETENGLRVMLVGNPNVGKSTVFNALTGMHQHTGNWCGKTVTLATGTYTYQDKLYTLIDLPGCCSLSAESAEEAVAKEAITENAPDCVVVVCDATSLERSLRLVLEMLQFPVKIVVCVNLMDEAEKKGVTVRINQLECLLGVPVVATASKGKRGYSLLKERIAECIDLPVPHREILEESPIKRAEQLAHMVVRTAPGRRTNPGQKADRFLAGKWGIAVMGLLLLVVFWITIVGANYPSRWLESVFGKGEARLFHALKYIGLPEVFCSAAVYGVYRMVARVVSVMLPPMAIFFPLFTLLEDAGYLPRAAFILDKCFQKCHACGKQALTMCMGFGCNAAGVVGARIIDSPRERLIAILTNTFVPCNGRFPTLILLISAFFATSGMFQSATCALMLMAVVAFGVLITFLVSRLLSATVLKGVSSYFVLELPPYRKPQIGSVILRSVFDRTLFVLGRAVSVAAPAGLLIWLLANTNIGEDTILTLLAGCLDGFGKLLGMDGVILLAFILGFPANETVIPIMLMVYLSQGTMGDMADLATVRQVLSLNGWTWLTAMNVMIFSLCHWPCSTTLLTIKKETGSIPWTLAAAAIPTIVGIIICMITTAVFRLPV